MHKLLASIFEANGLDIADLSSSGNLITHGPTSKVYIGRVASTSSSLAQMRGEASGLKAMSLTSPSLIPTLLGFEVSENGKEGAMVSQYFDLSSSGTGRGSAEAQRELGRRLAKMHTPPTIDEDDAIKHPGFKGGYRYTGKYGFGVPTHCGVTELDNTWEESWEDFYRDRRLGDMVRRIGDKQINAEWEKMKQRAVPLLLRNISPAPRPVICHGDLWSGNYGVDGTTDEPVVYDPASYWGHNESDLGVMHMFGGFTSDFFDEYHKISHKSSPHYDERQKLYELFHHLNHTLMFGGSYKSGSLGIMRNLNSWAEGQELPGEKQ